MAYVNEFFTTVGDLGGIDDHIAKLSDECLDIEAIAEQKAASRPRGLVSLTSSSRSTDRYNKAVDDVIQQVKLLEGGTTELMISGIDDICQKWGSIDVLLALKQMLIKKQKMADSIRYLNRVSDVETLLGNVVGNAGVIRDKLLALREEPELVPEAIPILNQSIAEAVAKAREELSQQLRPLIPLKWPAKIGPEDHKKIVNLMSQLNLIQAIDQTPTYPNGWWSVDLLVEPYVDRFMYHFTTPGIETNKISKPEWALEFVEQILTDHLDVINMAFATVLPDRIFAMEVITSLLVPVRAKMKVSVEAINKLLAQEEEVATEREKTGRLLSHLIYELSAFDQRLRQQFKYNPYATPKSAPSERWLGLVGDVLLADKEAVNNWLTFEYELASKRFTSEILGLPDAYAIDFEYRHNDKSRGVQPTYSAYNMSKLLANLTSHFAPILAVKYQLKFVLNVEIKLLELYLAELNKKFREFTKLFASKLMLSFLPKAVAVAASASEAERRQQLEQNSVENGLKALEMATGVLCSAQFISDTLTKALSQLIYVQLLEFYYTHQGGTGLVFDATIAKYDDLVTKVLAVYGDFFSRELKNRMKAYINQTAWDIDHAADDANPQLVPLVEALHQYIHFIRRGLLAGLANIVLDTVLLALCNLYYEYVVDNNGFTAAGVKQLRLDLKYLYTRLEDDLALEVNAATNGSYQKLQLAVVVLSIGPSQAQAYSSGERPLSDLRSQFDDQLAPLTSHQLMGLLPRIM